MKAWDSEARTAATSIQSLFEWDGEYLVSPFHLITWTIQTMHVKEQSNSWDCGPIVVDNALAWLESLHVPHDTDGHTVRLQMARWPLMNIISYEYNQQPNSSLHSRNFPDLQDSFPNTGMPGPPYFIRSARLA